MSEFQEPITVRLAQAAEMLGMSPATFQRWLPDLKVRGLKCVRGRYMVETLRTSFEKMCDEHSGNIKRSHRQNGRAADA